MGPPANQRRSKRRLLGHLVNQTAASRTLGEPTAAARALNEPKAAARTLSQPKAAARLLQAPQRTGEGGGEEEVPCGAHSSAPRGSLVSRVAPRGTPSSAPRGSLVSRVAPSGAPSSAPRGSLVSRVAPGRKARVSDLLAFYSVTERYGCVTVALRLFFYSVTPCYAPFKNFFYSFKDKENRFEA